MATTILIFSDGHDIKLAQYPDSPKYTFSPGYQCKVKLQEDQQFYNGEYTGIRCSNSTVSVKVNGKNEEVYFTDIFPIRETQEQNYLSSDYSYDMFGNKRVNTSIQPGIYTLMQLIAASSTSI